MNVDTYEIAFSFDEPNTILNPLRNVIQQMLNQPHIRTANSMSLLDGRMLLVIDTQRERAEQLARLFSAFGYRPFIALNALDAFTLFLQGTCVPFAIILGDEDTATRFFLQRLLQQLKQRYDWDTPLIRLRNQQQAKLPSQFTGFFPQLPKTEALPLERTSRPLRAFPALPSPAKSSMPTASRQLPALPAPKKPTTPSFTATSRTHAPSTIQQIPPTPTIPQPALVSLKGQDIGRYHIQEQLNKGNTYRTYDRLREHYVALKAIQTHTIAQKGSQETAGDFTFFQQEKDIIETLNHPSILPIANCGKSYMSGVPFVYKTMPYCVNGSLADWFYRQGTKEVDAKDIVAFVSQLGDGLQHAHDCNILYLNFKLSNILLRSQPRNAQQLHGQWADFAVFSHEIGFTKTQGTYPYMAPECWSGQPLAVSDQYGFAAIIYELLTGRPPFQGNSEQIMRHLHMNMPVHPPSMYNRKVSRRLDNVLLRALAKRPEERFSSITHFLRAFQQYCS